MENKQKWLVPIVMRMRQRRKGTGKTTRLAYAKCHLRRRILEGNMKNGGKCCCEMTCALCTRILACRCDQAMSF